MKIQTILDQIDLGSMALPEFQRGYVWNGDQVKRLMLSLYLQHPVGSLLIWVTKTVNARVRVSFEPERNPSRRAVRTAILSRMKRRATRTKE